VVGRFLFSVRIPGLLYSIGFNIANISGSISQTF
jgi:hypothetical protein